MEAVSPSEYGRRLLPQVVDKLASTSPERVCVSFPRSAKLDDGFRNLTMAGLSQAVNEAAWFLKRNIIISQSFEPVCYVGLPDVRYCIMLLAAIKCGFRLLLISPRNKVSQNTAMLKRLDCRNLVHSEGMSLLTDHLKMHTTTTSQLPLLDDLLRVKSDVESFQYRKTFEEAIDDPVLILHSSGTTGDPKLVQMTNGSFSVVDQSRDIPCPPGRRMQNASLFDFGPEGGRFYAPFPPYHLAGVQAFVSIPIFSEHATLVVGPQGILPNGVLLGEILRRQRLRALYLPPAIIEQWTSEPDACEKAANLDFIIYGGGPLSPVVGKKLETLTQICQTYGSIETAGVQLLVPGPTEWQYLEFNPYEECDMQDMGDGTYELVLHQRPELSWRRALSHNMPEIETWKTGDLFTPSKTNPKLWQFSGRIDDLIVMGNGLKLRPVKMEALIQGHPDVAGAIIFGQGKYQPALLLEPTVSAAQKTTEVFLDDVWPLIESANQLAPGYGRLTRSRIVIGSLAKPFPRNPKGNVVRRLTLQEYSKEIETCYSGEKEHVGSSTTGTAAQPDITLHGLEQFILDQAQALEGDIGEGSSFTKDTDFFMRGLDSLKMSELAERLRTYIGVSLPKLEASISLRLVYRYPSAGSLAQAVHDLSSNTATPQNSSHQDLQAVNEAFERLSRDLPEPHRIAKRTARSKKQVLITGASGAIGLYVVHSLLLSPQVEKIHCLHRSTTAEEGSKRLHKLFIERGLGDSWDPHRLAFHTADLSAPQLSLGEDTWAQLKSDVDIVIHNAWELVFLQPLAYFTPVYLRATRTLLDFSAASGARLVLASSTSSVQEWSNALRPAPVPESLPADPAADPAYTAATPKTGYAQSKQVAERLLAHAARAHAIPATILRLGQAAGTSAPAAAAGNRTPWRTDDWIPAMLRIAAGLHRLPVGFARVNWVPVDCMGAACAQLALHEPSGALAVFNVAHPRPVEMDVVLAALRARAPGREVCTESLPEWVAAAAEAARAGGSGVGATAARHLPWFEDLAAMVRDGRAVQPSLEMREALAASSVLRDLPPTTVDDISRWYASWED